LSLNLSFLKNLTVDPEMEDLRKLTFKQKNVIKTEFNNPDAITKAKARSARNTYVVTDDTSITDTQTISTKEGDRIAMIQDEFMKNREMIAVNGYIGLDDEVKVPAQLVIQKEYANVAAMQKSLYFEVDKSEDFTPLFQIVMTPDLEIDGYENNRVIAVYLDKWVTRVINSDYFGESKKGGLRMWNKYIYEKGGLALHAGCKIVPTGKGEKSFLIIGLSGTGKTTTTFTDQNGSQPVQDDFVALMPNGKAYGTERGCFAKTFGLDKKNEPIIYEAVTKETSFLENVTTDENGKVDFYGKIHSENGRAIFLMSDIPNAKLVPVIEKANFLLILNRNENIIPAVAKLDKFQAAAYFMLGETTGTSAGGKAEEGKFLRIPGTNPFFPLRQGFQGNRLKELLEIVPMEVYIMNTGRVGGKEDTEGSLKVKIAHSSAIVKGIAEGTIKWKKDNDFGYEVAETVPGISNDDIYILQPIKLYEKLNRLDEYYSIVKRLKAEREEHLKKYSDLEKDIISSIA
jgi:phosphoenolpyruvate carboxykinase (ATP)